MHCQVLLNIGFHHWNPIRLPYSEDESFTLTCGRRPAAPAPASREHHWPQSRPGIGRALVCCLEVPPRDFLAKTLSSKGTPETLSCWWRRGSPEVPSKRRAGRKTPHPELVLWTRPPGHRAPALREVAEISNSPCCHLRSATPGASVFLLFQRYELPQQSGTTTAQTLNATKPCSRCKLVPVNSPRTTEVGHHFAKS